VRDEQHAEHGADAELLEGIVRARLFDELYAPPQLGRFVLEGRLGAGGMGVVYAAHDPELDRRVAIKLLETTGDAALLAARLRREAQAMARLAHPNVVAVFEVGEHAGAAFVAMELVDGQTLTHWLRAPGRRRADVLAAFAAAGEGLAAAHDAGLVHRDFKPDNVLVGRDDRPRVGDFGLVRGLGGPPRTEPEPEPEPDAHGDHLPPIDTTRTTELAGTPAYMAPELFEGSRGTTQSDQYAFCVALYEALFGVRPHDAPDLAGFVAARMRGDLVFPSSPRVSRPLRRLLARGLDRDPTRRFPTMRALLDALDRARRPSRRLWLGVAAMAATAAAVVIVRDDGRACARGVSAIDASWNHEHRAATRAALADDDVVPAYATAVADRVVARLDGFVDDWRAAHEAACAAADGGTQTHELVTRQLVCLERRRLELDAFVGALEGASTSVIGRALPAATALPSPSLCGEVQALLDDVAPAADAIAPAVAEVRAQLAQAKSTLDVAADADAARRLAEAALERARTLGYAPLVAEAGLRLAVTTLATGDLPGAEALLEHAYFDAIAAGHEVVALQTAASLLHTLGVRGGRPSDALVWWNHGEALLRKRGPSPRESHQLRNSYAAVLAEQAKYAESLEVARQAVADADAGYGADHPNALNARQNLAAAHLGLGQYVEALAVYEDVVARLERMYGEDHPAVASAMANTAIALGNLGRNADALEQHRRALAIFERTIGANTMEAGYTLANMGNIHNRLGDPSAALASTLRAREALTQALGPEDPRTITLGGNIGQFHRKLGQLDEARSALQATIDALTRIDAKHPELPNNFDRLGLVELDAGDCERSLSHHERAFALATELSLPPFTLAYQQLNMGIALDCLGRFDDAIPQLERARDTWIARGESSAAQRANAELALAGALVGAGRAAEALAQAQSVLRACDASTCDDLRRADALVVVAESQLELGEAKPARAAAEQALTLRASAPRNPSADGDLRWLVARARHADGVPAAELTTLLAEARTALEAAGPRGVAALERWPSWAR